MAEPDLYLDTELTSTSGAEKNAQIREAEQETAINREIHNDFAIDKTVKEENEIKHLIKSLKKNKINETEAETGSTISMDSQNPNTEAKKGFEITESSSSPLDLIHGQNDSNDSKRHTHVEILETRIGGNSFGTNTSEQETKLVQNESNNVESRSSEKSDTLINPKNLTTKAYTSFEITGSHFASLELTIDEQNDRKKQTRTEIYSTDIKPNPPEKEHTLLHNEKSGSSNGYTLLNSQNLNTEDDKRFIITESGSDPNDNRQQTHAKVNDTRIKTNSCVTNSFEQETKWAQNGNETNYDEGGSNEESDILTNTLNLTTEADTSFEITERRSVSLELIMDKQINSKTQTQAEIDETRIKTNSCATNTSEQETNIVQNGNETDNTEGGYSEASTLIIPQTQNHKTDTRFEIIQIGSVPIEPIIDSKEQTYEEVKDTGTKSNSLSKDAPEVEHELVNNENKTSDADGGACEESATLNSQYLNTAADKSNSLSFATIINDQNDSEKQTHKDINLNRIKTNSFATHTPEQVTSLFQNVSTEKSTIFSATHSRCNLINRKPIRRASKKSLPKKPPQINSAEKSLETTKIYEETLSFKMKQSCKQQTYYDKGSLYCFIHNIVVSYWCKQCNVAKCEKCVNVAYCKRCVRHDVMTMAKYVQDSKKRQKDRLEKNCKDCLTELDRSMGVFERNEKQTQLQALYQRERIRQEFVSFYDLLNTTEHQILHTLDKTVDKFASQYKTMEKRYGSIVEEEAHLMAEGLRKTDQYDPFGYNVTDVDEWIDKEWRKLREKVRTMTVSVRPVPRIVKKDIVLLKEKTDLWIKLSSVVEPCEIIQTGLTLYLDEDNMVSPIRVCDLFTCTNSLYCLSELELEIIIRHQGKLVFKGKMKYEDHVFNYGDRHYLQDNQRYLVRARPVSRADDERSFNSKCKHVLIVTGQNTFSVKAGLMGYLEDVRERHGVAVLKVPHYRHIVSSYPNIVWPFSSVSGYRNFYDISPEELRCMAYQTDAASYMAYHSRLLIDIDSIRATAPFYKHSLVNLISDVEMDNTESGAEAEKTDELRCVDETALNQYTKLQEQVKKTEQDSKTLFNNPQLKKIKFDIQKAVNTPINTISPVRGEHLRDKLQRLQALLSGHTIEVSGGRFSLSGCPQALPFCKYLITKMIVKKGEEMVSAKYSSAFAVASVAVGLIADHPDLLPLLLGHFNQLCPYTVPYHIHKSEGQSIEDYFKTLGYKYDLDGNAEKQDQFLKRMSGIMRMYASIMVSHPPRGLNPYGIEYAWTWLSMVMNIDPLSDVTAAMTFDLLEVTGHALYRDYRKQFVKLLHVLIKEFLPKLKKAASPCGGGPMARLEDFLQNSVKHNGNIRPPEGLLNANFWMS